MASKFCMNEHCRTTTSSEWKKGWGLKSGGFATLCYTCGSAFENIAYCETFHLNESGWRECRMCKKPIHCGCIASQYLFEFMDFGGIGCLSCTRCLGGHTLMPIQIPNEDAACGIMAVTNSADTQHILFENKMDQNIFDKRRLLQFGSGAEASEPVRLFQFESHDKVRQEESIIPSMEIRLCIPNHNQQSPKSSLIEKSENCILNGTVKETAESFNQPSLNFFLSTPLGTSSPISSGVSPFQLEQKPHHILSKPPKASSNSGFETKSGISTPRRPGRPPTEGRGNRNQMLPRYWPRITDQELQKLSGDLKSTIVPLFEKVLSASDAGRIGRLIIPKACAEAYFPHIEQSEGMPIMMQDAKGKEWTFHFRFWPNNNSRMYVLEGVTPCIQNMQLEAGDTVTFSRIDPGGKLFMGFRKAVTNAAEPVGLQTSLLDSKNPAISDGGCSSETPLFGATDNQAMAKHENDGGSETDNFLQGNGIVPEKKKIRNIGCKSKRLLIDTEDVMELKITWQEAQDLLCPPPNVNPTIIMIEDCGFEEYDEPPVLGKRTVFPAPSSGEQGQWAQCDNCSKRRRLPVHDLLPSNCTCSDNIWDPNRCSCSASSEMNQKELDPFLRASNNEETKRLSSGCGGPSGLDALASVASLRDSSSSSNGNNLGGTEEPPPCTTKHPRHRPGCTCIVCIQPPSGTGKHDPTCKCNVCLTVRRRFKTLMMRKKKKPPERGAEIAQVKDGTVGHVSENDDDAPYPNGDGSPTSMGRLDLNCHPNENKAGS